MPQAFSKWRYGRLIRVVLAVVLAVWLVLVAVAAVVGLVLMVADIVGQPHRRALRPAAVDSSIMVAKPGAKPLKALKGSVSIRSS
jgi:hypothetical protein